MPSPSPNNPSEATQVDMTIRVGDAIPIVVTVLDSSGNPTVDLTGAHATYGADTLPTPITKDSTTPSQITIDAANNRVTINYIAGDTAGKTPGNYTHECRIRLATGPTIHTLFDGGFVLTQAVAATP